MPGHALRALRLFVLGACLFAEYVPSAQAGLGPENVLLVVNNASWASQTIANHYIALRKIPNRNVLSLEWREGTDSVNADVFRQKILQPILEAIETRGLIDQIDAVVYSSDFPYVIDITSDLGNAKREVYQTPHASLTGATYLYKMMLAKDANLVALRANNYVRLPGEPYEGPASRAFRHASLWDAKGDVVEKDGAQYLLSTMLAVTSGRGNSVAEALGYLRRASEADGTSPEGSIYFCKNNDVRSTTRAPQFPPAVEELSKENVKAEIVEGALPNGSPNVAGTMVGIADFVWGDSRNAILPGAICEHLTSFGGVMSEGAGQTPLSEFLRYGAAGTSGAVFEPYSVPHKFPLASIHVHYARGCSLAEAFYQSVMSPYQLLIVGDPLCRPWGHPPQVTLKGIEENESVTGQREITATATVKSGTVSRIEYFVDGRRVAKQAPTESFSLDTGKLAGGYHELRAVAYDARPIETPGRAVVTFLVENQEQKVTLFAKKSEVRADEPLLLAVKATGVKAGEVMFQGRSLAKFKGPMTRLKLDSRQLGNGPVSLYAVAEDDMAVSSNLLALVTKPATPLPVFGQAKKAGRARPTAKPRAAVSIRKRSTDGNAANAAQQGPPLLTQLESGLLLKLANGKFVPAESTQPEQWLSTAGVKPNEEYAAEAFFEVAPPATNTVASASADMLEGPVVQFQLRHTGELQLAIDDTKVYDDKQEKDTQVFVPVALAPGIHRLRLVGQAGPEVKLQIRYGGEGTKSLHGNEFRHIKPASVPESNGGAN